MKENLEDRLRQTLTRKAETIEIQSLRLEDPTDLTIGLSAGETTAPRRRNVLTAAAVLLVVVAIAGVVVTRNPGPPRTPLAAGPPAASPPTEPELRVWPLNGDEPLPVPSEGNPRTPDLVAQEYLTEVLALPPDWPVQDLTSQDGTSVANFVLQDVDARLTLRREESGTWVVTGASTELMRPTLTAIAAAGLEISLTAGPRTSEAGLKVRLTALAADGSTLATNEARVQPAPAETPATLEWNGTELAAVIRVDALDDHDSDPATLDVIVGHWSTGVPGPPEVTLPSSCDASRGSAIFRSDGTPDQVALAYLKSRFPDYPTPGVTTAPARTRGARAFVNWSVEADIAYGTIFLRRTSTDWAVIASTTSSLDLSAIEVDADRLRGTITTTNDNALFADVLRVDGSPVAGSPRPNGQPDAAYRFATAGGPANGTIKLDVPLVGEAPTLRAGLVGGTILAVAECRPSIAS